MQRLQTTRSYLFATATFLMLLASAGAALADGVPPKLHDWVIATDSGFAFLADVVTVRASDGTLESGIEIRWSTPTLDNVRFEVFRDGNLLTWASAQDSSYLDTGVDPLQTATYEVRLVDLDSDAVVEMGSDDGTRGFFAPRNVSASEFDLTGIRVVWTDDSTIETSYTVLRDGIELATVPADGSSYQDETAAPLVTYEYCVRARAGSIETPLGTAVCDQGTRPTIPVPTGIEATVGIYPDRVVVTWNDNAEGESGYRVTRDGTPFELPANTTMFEDTGAIADEEHEYCVFVLDPGGAASLGGCATGIAGALRLPPPMNLLATGGGDAGGPARDDIVLLTWEDAPTEDRYEIRRGPDTIIAEVEAGTTRFEDADAATGEQHVYYVAALSDMGTRSLSLSNRGELVDVVAPLDMQASDGTSETHVDITWESSATKAVLFEIRRDGVGVRTVAGDARSARDLGATPGVIHTYDVVAQTATGAEASSSDVGSRVLAAPTTFEASDDALEDRVQLTWTDNSQVETRYLVYRQESETPSTLTQIAELGPNRTSYADLTAAPGITYDYLVAAADALGESSRATDEGRRTLNAPTELVASRGSSETQIELSWRDNSGIEDGYRLARIGNYALDDGELEGTLSPNEGVASGLIVVNQLVAEAGRTTIDRVEAYFPWVMEPFVPIHVGLWSDPNQDGDPADAQLLGTALASPTTPGWISVPLAAPVDVGAGSFFAGVYWVDSGPGGVISLQIGVDFDYAGPNEAWSKDTEGPQDPSDLSGMSEFGGDVFGIRVRTRDGIADLPPNSTSYTDGMVTIGQPQDYVLTAFVAGVVSGESAGATAQGLASVLAPGAPHVADGSAPLVSWTDRSRVETGYRITRDGQEIGQTPPNVMSFRDNFPTAGVRHEYCVETLADAGVASDPVCAVGNIPGRVDGALEVVGDGSLRASDGTLDNRVRLEWSPQGSGEVTLYRDYAAIATLEGTVASFDDFDALPGTAHRYAISGTSTGEAADVGWRPSDGVVAGTVATRAGAAVEGVQVCLDPSPNQALRFVDDHRLRGTFSEVFDSDEYTVEFWAKLPPSSTEKIHPIAALEAELSNPEFGNSNVELQDRSDGDFVLLRAFSQAGLEEYLSGDLSGFDVFNGEWQHWAVRWTTTTWSVVLNGQLVHEASLNIMPRGFVATRLGDDGSYALDGTLDEMRLWGAVRTEAEIRDHRFSKLEGIQDRLVAYWPMDAGGGSGVADATRNGNDLASRSSTADPIWVSDASPVTTCGVTDAEGSYSIRDIHYDGARTFQVTPSAPGRQFEPAFKSVSLDEQSPVQNQVGFNDVSAFTLSGVVNLRATGCVEAGVEIFVDGVFAGATRADGTFSISAQPGRRVIEARGSARTYVPTRREIDVSADTAGLDFENATTNELTLTISGGCGFPIGDVVFRIATVDGCFETTVTGGDGSAQVVRLPAQRYVIGIEGVPTNVPAPLSAADIFQFFTDLGGQEIDLTTGDASLDVTYRAPLSMIIAGFPQPTCNQFIDPVTGELSVGAPVMAQSDSATLTIDVFEDYGNGNTCPADSGMVSIFDEIQDIADNAVVLPIQDGRVTYVTRANTPGPFPGRQDAQGNNRSFQKPITFVAAVEGRDSITRTEWALVTGDRARAGTFVSATSEEIPLLILRDPPGDGSKAFLERGRTLDFELSNVLQRSLTTSGSTAIKAGFAFEAGTPFWSTDTEVGVETSLGFEVGVSATLEGNVAISVTTTEEFSTSDIDTFVGEDADLMMGVALNLVFAKTDRISVDGNQEPCPVQRSEAVRFGGKQDQPFRTIYLYTTNHVRSNIIPQLNELAALAPADSVRYRRAVVNWQEHLALNDSLRTVALADIDENRSFSAGADLAFSITRERSETASWDVKVFTTAALATELGFEAAGSGASTTFGTELSFATTFGGSRGETAFMSTGYSLTDDDIGDYFTVDIATDPVYGTPVFRTRSGRSSCPLEPNTQPRDAFDLTVDRRIVTGVAEDGAAELLLTLRNTSDSQELREIGLRQIQTSNTDGAILKLNGAPLDQEVSFFVESGAQQLITLTVERGPSKYFYPNLAIEAAAPCELAIFRNGGALAVADTASFSVTFDSPCSDITLASPASGWTFDTAASAATSDTLRLTLDGFQLAISETDSIMEVGAEYRVENTDVWLPVGSLSAADIAVFPPSNVRAGEPMPVHLPWDVSGVNDGNYEIRAFTRCQTGRVVGEIASGRIDRQAPEVTIVQPADGALALGGLISISFNEPIDCTTVTPLNVLLQVNDGGPTPVQIETVCSGSTILIHPTVPTLDVLEGQSLTATVQNVRDVVGNPLPQPTTWTFDVRRSAFTWAEADLFKEASFGAPGALVGTLVNGSDTDRAYDISSLPPWLTATPGAGSVVAGQSNTVTFAIDPNLPIAPAGSYVDTVFASSPDSTNPATQAALIVRVDVVCAPPSWAVTQRFEHTMTAVLRPTVDLAILDQPEDRVAAFVGNELRGVASPTAVPNIGPVVFLNVGSNRTAGENVRFQLFDASECRLYPSASTFLRFEADRRQGTPENPVIVQGLDTLPSAQQSVSLNAGWTWFSLNLLNSQDMSTLSVLGDLNPQPGDVIKSQISFSEYTGASIGWVGTLTELNNRESYSISLGESGVVLHDGDPVAPDLTIPLRDGWNWVGYPPGVSQDVNTALANLTPANGDIIKSQQGFAEYVANQNAWIGDLGAIDPGVGYKLYVANGILAGPLRYASTPFAGDASSTVASGKSDGASSAGALVSPSPGSGAHRPDWSIERGRQYNMTVVGSVDLEGERLRSGEALIGAFVGDELRGVGTLQPVDPYGESMTFLMIHADEPRGERVRFALYDPETDAVWTIAEELDFVADAAGGTLAEPFVFHATAIETNASPLPAAFALQPMFPNPIRPGGPVTIRWAMPEEEHATIRIYDVTGRMVREIVDETLAAGWYTRQISADGLASGTYFYRLDAGRFTKAQKFVLLK